MGLQINTGYGLKGTNSKLQIELQLPSDYFDSYKVDASLSFKVKTCDLMKYIDGNVKEQAVMVAGERDDFLKLILGSNDGNSEEFIIRRTNVAATFHNKTVWHKKQSSIQKVLLV